MAIRLALLDRSQGKRLHAAVRIFRDAGKLPPGPGLWPAFWLVANRDPDTSAEIDIMEHYGVAPDKFESVMHVWPKDGRGRQYQERLVTQFLPAACTPTSITSEPRSNRTQRPFISTGKQSRARQRPLSTGALCSS